MTHNLNRYVLFLFASLLLLYIGSWIFQIKSTEEYGLHFPIPNTSVEQIIQSDMVILQYPNNNKYGSQVFATILTYKGNKFLAIIGNNGSSITPVYSELLEYPVAGNESSPLLEWIGK